MTPLNFHHFDLLANIRDPRPWTPSPHRDNETDIIKDENHEIAPPDEKRKERAPRTLSNKALISRLKRRGLDNRIAEILADDIANELETSNAVNANASFNDSRRWHFKPEPFKEED